MESLPFPHPLPPHSPARLPPHIVFGVQRWVVLCAVGVERVILFNFTLRLGGPLSARNKCVLAGWGAFRSADIHQPRGPYPSLRWSCAGIANGCDVRVVAAGFAQRSETFSSLN